jgi:hypothetical protein
MTLRLALIGALLLSACASRPLTEAERDFAGTVMAGALDLDEVTVVRGAVSAALPTTVPPRPRTTCSERLRPPRDGRVPGVFSAFVVGDRMFFSRRSWKPDLMAGYPDRLVLDEAMRLAHELTHVWQWQARSQTGYFPHLAFFEHVESDDPYLTEIDPGLGFLDYGWEQQGTIVEEFVCCRTLDPEAPRTEELHRLVSQVFPGAARRGEVRLADVELPWDGAEPQGICR